MSITSVVNYEDASEHQYDSNYVDISSGQITFKSQEKDTERFMFNFDTDGDLLPKRGTATLELPDYNGANLNTAEVINGELAMTNADLSWAQILNASMTLQKTFTKKFKFKVNFTTTSVSKTMMFMDSNIDDSSVEIYLTNQGAGVTRIWAKVINGAGAQSLNTILEGRSFAIGDTVDVAIASNDTTFIITIDGVIRYSSAQIGMNMTDCSFYYGRKPGDATSVKPNHSYNDVQLWEEFLDMATGLPSSEDTTYTKSQQLIATTMPLLMDRIFAFSTTEDIPTETQVGYLLMKNVDPYWYNSVNFVWEISDGSIAKTNTPAEIDANVSTFPLVVGVGAYIQIIKVIKSLSGYHTPIIESFTMEYGFTFAMAEINTCVVYGEVVNNKGEPVVGAIIEFDTTDRVQNNAMVFPKGKTETNVFGKWSMALVETESIPTSGTFTVTYDNDGEEEEVIYKNKIIPDFPSKKFEDLLTEV